MISLGQASNYKPWQVFRHLFAFGTKRDSELLRRTLANHYGVLPRHVALYHTGRSALTAAIKSVAGGEKLPVFLPGLTCIAVVRAIKAAGCEPVFVDIQPGTLEYDYGKLGEKLSELKIPTEETQENPKIHYKKHQKPVKSTKSIDKKLNVCYNRSIVLVQNTLGYVWDISKLLNLSKKYGFLIVEDLAHSAGRYYRTNHETGTYGAAVALSFGKGKAIDTVSGGAVVLRNGQLPTPPPQKPKLSDRLRDRWYPLFGLISRIWWPLGRYFMSALVKLHLVQRSADAELNLDHRLTHWQAKLANKQFKKLPTDAPLRHFRYVHDRPQALKDLYQHGYNLEETWYDTPVSPQRYADEANFPAARCPRTVEISEHIINLPGWCDETKLLKAYDVLRNYEVEE